jgi:hypothetical protein
MRRSQVSTTDRGAIAVVAAIVFIPLSLMLAVVVDAGRVWVDKHRLQNGVEAAAVAVAAEWGANGVRCSSSSLAFVGGDGARPDSTNCSITGTQSSGVARVDAQESVSLIFGNLLGRETSQVRASTAVRVGPAESVIGLWPFGLCVNHPSIAQWIAGGMSAGVSTRITFQEQNQRCGGDVSGNWATLDFSGGSNSNSETQSWIDSGYLGWVEVGDVISGSPGAPSISLAMTGVIGQSIQLPLYSNPRNQGANALYTIVGFAQAVVVAAQFSGASAQRSITIRFERGTTSGGTGVGSGGNYGLIAWSVCSFDSFGECS